jgi:putative transposase
MRYAEGGGLSEQGRAKREGVRLQAAEWFAEDVPVVLASKGPGGSDCRLDAGRLDRLAQALEQGPAVHGFGTDQRWTLPGSAT